MPTSLSAALQVLALVVVLAAAYRPLGDYMARVFTSDRHWRVERGVYRVIGVDPSADQRWPVYLRSVLAFSLVSMVVALRHPAAAGATCPTRWDARACRRCRRSTPRSPSSPTRTGSPTRGEAALGYLVADGRAGRAELRVGRGRHRRRGRARPRLRPHAHRPARQLLGRPRPRITLRILLPLRGRLRGRPGDRRRRPELRRRHRRSPRSPAGRRRSPAARSPPRRRSRSSAPTAAASSTPTPRTRSRTRTAFTNLLEIFLLLVIPFSLHAHLRADGRRPAAGLRDPRRDGRRSSIASIAPADLGRGRRTRARRCSSPARRWRARRCASASRCRRCSPSATTLDLDRRGRTRCTTASRRSAAGSRSST